MANLDKVAWGCARAIDHLLTITNQGRGIEIGSTRKGTRNFASLLAGKISD